MEILHILHSFLVSGYIDMIKLDFYIVEFNLSNEEKNKNLKKIEKNSKKGLHFWYRHDIIIEVRWSSGQDAALSRRKHGFDSRTDCSVFYTEYRWFIGQAVKTPPSHGGNRGSIPL